MPALRAGDRAFCNYRGCEVVVRGSSGPAGWPRGRAPGWRGMSSPVVTEELALAIRRESPWALCRWLGVSLSLVRGWCKKLLG